MRATPVFSLLPSVTPQWTITLAVDISASECSFKADLKQCRWSLVGKLVVTQLGLHPIFQSFTIYEYIEYGAGGVPWQPPNSTATLQRWRNGRWTHWPFGSNWWKKEETQHCFAWGMHTVYLHSNVFHHHGISIWMAYILACFLSYIEPPVGFQFCCNNDSRIPPPHTPHHPLQAFIITVTLGARPWIPTLLRRVSPGSM